MGDATANGDLQILLEHSGWVRELARRLASGADADDIEQATWLAALRHTSERRGPVREWLGAIARNFARQQRRSSGRRSEHEQRAARGEQLPDTVELLARAEVQRKLVGAVMQLDEPYRTAVLLRWFENLPPREIAERLNVPVATVRTRLARALERLRARLDAEHGGDRAGWVAAFAPLLPTLRPDSWPTPGPDWGPALGPTLEGPSPGLGALLVVNAKIVAACVALGAVGAVAWWFSTERTSGAQESVATAAPVRAPERAAPSSSGASHGAEPERAAVEAPRESTPTAARSNSRTSPAATSAVSLRLAGRVLDASGAPVADVRVVARAAEGAAGAGEAEAVSSRDGSFEIAEGPSHGAIASGSRGFATVFGATFGQDGRDEAVVVVAPRVGLAGVVVDEQGFVVENADLAVEMPDDLRSRFTVVLDRARSQPWKTVSDSEGAFQLEDVPQVEGARVTASADGYMSWRAELPPGGDLAMRVVLARPRAADGYVRGIVIDELEQPLPGARVAFGFDTQRADDEGRFAFRIDDPESFGRRIGRSATRIVAAARGRIPAEFTPPLENGTPAWPSFVTLRLEGQTLSMSGRVVDAVGKPMNGVRVFVADATLFGAVDGRAAVVETLFAPGEETWKFVESDADGRFELDGLLDRDYVVRAHDPRTLLRVDSSPQRAGRTGLELKLPTDQLYPRVAGRVLTLDGTPVAGAEVFPMCDAFRVKFEGRPISTSHGGVEGTTTDEHGRFELENVPMSLVYLRVNGETILPVEYGRYVENDPRFESSDVRELPRERITDLEIRAEARCHMQVELRVTDLADELAVLDERGRELTVSLFDASGRRDTPRHPLHDGRSAVLSVPESGRTLVLFKAGVEVARAPIRLSASEATTVKL